MNKDEQNDTPDPVDPADLMAGTPDTDNPVTNAYGRTGRADTTGVSGIPASDEDAGAERRRLYEQGMTEVSRID